METLRRKLFKKEGKMKNLKRFFWAICAVVLAPAAYVYAEEGDLCSTKLHSGCYTVIAEDKTIEFCIDSDADIIPSDDVEKLEEILKANPEPITACI